VKIRQLSLRNFGPFEKYTIPFVEAEQACMLITGKNNEGKTNIINGLKLIAAATKVINKRKQEILVDEEIVWKLLQQDTENLVIGRMIYNYEETIAKVEAVFEGGYSICVYLDPKRNMVYADYYGGVVPSAENIFGFIPPLGPLNEREEIIRSDGYMKACLDTSLAPRHIRNHLTRTLSPEEYCRVREIIKTSWENVELLDCEINYADNRISCYYREGRIEREIAWAGQGLQVWFQIITHLVRLRSTSVLILDEPEINLHPEKQNDLVRIIKDHYAGSVIIATHSVELMNNVNVSHIIHVEKRRQRPQIKSTEDRNFLDSVRSRVGSNFNLIASQFDDFDTIIFTEDYFDFAILKDLAAKLNIRAQAFNIPLYGFSEYEKAIHYKAAYELLIGKHPHYTVVLDRDYYPESYLRRIKVKLQKHGVETVFTPGKEIENLFLSPRLINTLFTGKQRERFSELLDELFKSQHLDCYGSYLTLHQKFLDPKLDTKSITKKYTPAFDKKWQSRSTRWKMIAGKDALHTMSRYYREEFGRNLSQRVLVDALVASNDPSVREFVNKIYHHNPKD
jgi:hypothetical protein